MDGNYCPEHGKEFRLLSGPYSYPSIEDIYKFTKGARNLITVIYFSFITTDLERVL